MLGDDVNFWIGVSRAALTVRGVILTGSPPP
jgi:hypothetical protein